MKKIIAISLLILGISLIGYSQNCPKFPSMTTVKSSTTYINDPYINNGKDTVLYQMTFLENNKPIDCSLYKIQMSGMDYNGVPFTRKDVKHIEGTSMFQFWLPPAIVKPMVCAYQVVCITDNLPVRSSSVMIMPKKK